jgi:two-component system C4-dicarboxylate transport sensor histidine kinase DctB
MKKFRSVETLAGGSAVAICALVLIVTLTDRSLRVVALIAGVVGLAAVIAILIRAMSARMGAMRDAALELDEKNEAVSALTAELYELSLIDPLTGARNRRGFIDLVEHQMRVATREWKQLHFVFVDVDEMKRINEIHGHAAGDSALVEVVEIIWGSSRTVDIVGRMGGDEFAVALIHADDPSVVVGRIEEAMRTRVRDTERPYELHVTVGFSSFDPAAPVSLDEMLRTAHQAMFDQRRAAAQKRVKKLASPAIR